MEGIHTHGNAIMITTTIYNHVVKRVFFKSGIASGVLYYDAMNKLGIFDDHLKPFPTSLIVFGNEKVKVQGVVSLPFTLGE